MKLRRLRVLGFGTSNTLEVCCKCVCASCHVRNQTLLNFLGIVYTCSVLSLCMRSRCCRATSNYKSTVGLMLEGTDQTSHVPVIYPL